MRSSVKPTLIVVLGLLILFGARVLFTQEASQVRPSEMRETEDSLGQETYVSQVVISAPWGERNLVYDNEESPPGEFGYHVDEETAVGPSCFAVAPNGDIYIADPLNNRMQRSDSQGGFICTIPMPRTIADICIDRDNSIYLYGGGHASGGCILKYDQEGNLLKTYPLFTSFSRTGGFIYCDKSGRVFVAPPEGGPYQIGTSAEVFSVEQQRSSEIDGFLGINSTPLDENLYFQGSPMSKAPHNRLFRYYAVSFDGDTVYLYRGSKGIKGSFFGCDEQLNIYVTDSDHSANIVYIRKYNPTGNLLSSFKYMCEEPYSTVSGFGNRAMTLDEKGNLYMLCCSEEVGIKVIKWYRQLVGQEPRAPDLPWRQVLKAPDLVSYPSDCILFSTKETGRLYPTSNASLLGCRPGVSLRLGRLQATPGIWRGISPVADRL